MRAETVTSCTAFSGHTCVACGSPQEVARAMRVALDADPHACILAFDDDTARQLEFDLRGTPDEVAERLTPAPASAPEPEAPRGPGRPKLGVVAREVTLLPRHWEWLASRPGGASVTLRRLVDEARKANAEQDRIREARDVAYRFMLATCGDLPGFEEATRALYAGDEAAFNTAVENWPVDVRDHSARLAAPGLVPCSPASAE